MTPRRPAIALVIEESVASGPRGTAGALLRWLLVRRPEDDPDLPGVWGLPAGSHAEGETDEALVRRIGREKLGVETADLGRLCEGHLERPGYRLEMRLHAARNRCGRAPCAPVRPRHHAILRMGLEAPGRTPRRSRPGIAVLPSRPRLRGTAGTELELDIEALCRGQRRGCEAASDVGGERERHGGEYLVNGLGERDPIPAQQHHETGHQ